MSDLELASRPAVQCPVAEAFRVDASACGSRVLMQPIAPTAVQVPLNDIGKVWNR